MYKPFIVPYSCENEPSVRQGSVDDHIRDLKFFSRISQCEGGFTSDSRKSLLYACWHRFDFHHFRERAVKKVLFLGWRQADVKVLCPQGNQAEEQSDQNESNPRLIHSARIVIVVNRRLHSL